MDKKPLPEIKPKEFLASGMNVAEFFQELKFNLIQEVMKKSKTQTQAAKLLGMTRSNLVYYLNESKPLRSRNAANKSFE